MEHLRVQAAQHGIALTDTQLDRFRQYLDLLRTWNRKINLTSVSEPQAVLDLHFLDSLMVVPLLGSARRLIDVGSGGGFPGLPIAIAAPALAVTLLEATHKKAAFLRAAVHALELSAAVIDGRVEELLKKPFERFDLAISRATFPASEWLALGRRLVHQHGAVVVMTGRDPPPGSPTKALSYELPGGELRHLGWYSA